MNIIEQIKWIIELRMITLKVQPNNVALKASISALNRALLIIEEGCEWKFNIDEYWETECGEKTIDCPKEFCQFCGRKVRWAR